MSHAADHQRMLEALSAGESSESAPEVQARLRDCAECAREWHEMKQTTRALDRTSARMDAALKSMPNSGTAPGQVEAERALRDEMARARGTSAGGDAPPGGNAQPGGAPNGKTSNGRRRLWIALAAAILLVGSIALFNRRSADRGEELMGAHLTAHAIERADGGRLRFAWSGNIGADEIVSAEIEGRDGSSDVWKPILNAATSMPREGLPKSGWIAEPELVRAWPREIRWRIVAHDAQDGFRGESDWSPIFSLR